MKKSTMVTWLTVLLCIVFTLGATALAEEGEEWSGVPSPAAQAVAAAQSEPAPQPAPAEQQPQALARLEPVDTPTSGNNGAQPEAQQPEAQQPGKPPAEESEPANWEDPSDEPTSGEEGPDPAENPAMHSVRFINANGDVLFAYESAAGTAVADPQFSPTLNGHSFSHWYQAGSNPNVSFNFGSSLEGDLTLAAFFKQTAPAITPEPAEDENTDEADPAGEDPAEEYLPPIQVKITSDADETLRLGDRVTLTAQVSGQLEGETLTLWRYNAGGNWVVAATNTQTHSFVVDENNRSWTWEFVITVNVGAAS